MVNNYWVGKEIRANKAYDHTREMERKYKQQISNSFYNTKIYSSIPLMKQHGDIRDKTIDIYLYDTDTVSAIMDICCSYNGKTAALNFASYKNPGGMFLKGSSAQEESLCHESFLFNVLRRFEDFYKYNRENLNNSLYTDRALYTPDVCFIRNENNSVSCDIITCAAPNKGSAMKYHHIQEYDNTFALLSRIRFILSIAEDQEVDNLILGAYGCGVFKQDPYEVASLFKQEIKYIKPCRRIIFAIPPSYNSDVFAKVFFNS